MSKAERLHNEMRLYDTVQECDIETNPLVWWNGWGDSDDTADSVKRNLDILSVK